MTSLDFQKCAHSYIANSEEFPRHQTAGQRHVLLTNFLDLPCVKLKNNTSYMGSVKTQSSKCCKFSGALRGMLSRNGASDALSWSQRCSPTMGPTQQNCGANVRRRLVLVLKLAPISAHRQYPRPIQPLHRWFLPSQHGQILICDTPGM